jgi:rhamnose utilization protein RhaD (predicted bifunctional aldolase and dehydrogenase)
MTQATPTFPSLKFPENLWHSSAAATLPEPELLRHRSNQPGSGLRIVHFAGSNTSSKIDGQIDPLTSGPAEAFLR